MVVVVCGKAEQCGPKYGLAYTEDDERAVKRDGRQEQAAGHHRNGRVVHQANE